MKDKIKKWIRPALFILGGVLAGFAYYYFVGCTTDSCAITSNPVNSMIYGIDRLVALWSIWKGV